MDKIEKIDKSLEEEIQRTYHDGSVADTLDMDHVDYENIAHHFAEWGAEHLRDSTKMINKSLEEAAEEYRRESFKRSVMPQIDGPINEYGGSIKDAFIAGWKCRDDQMPMPEDTVLFQKGVAEGRRLEREDMLKDAIHYVVQDDLDSHGKSYNIPFIRIGMVALKPKGIGVGDKVRIIVVKDESK